MAYRYIAVYDPATGTAVEISKPIANTFEFSRVDFDTGELSPTGSRLYQGDSSSCSFSFLDPDGSVSFQLLAWKKARTRVSMVAIGPSVAVQWYEKDHISISQSTLGGMIRGRGDRWDFEIRREGHGAHSIYRQANLLGGLGWDDANSDNVPDGYTSFLPGTGSTAFNFGSDYSLQLNADELSGVYYDVVLPFATTKLTMRLTAEATELHTSSSTYRIQTQWLNFAGTALDTTITTVSSLGLVSGSPADQTALSAPYALRCWPIIMPTSNSGTMTGKEFRLRLGTATGFTIG